MAAYSFSNDELPIEHGQMDIETRDDLLSSSYTNVEKNQAKFGKSIITFGHQHDATFFGRDNDGSVYVFTKNGPNVAPGIMKLEDLENKGSFGSVRNLDICYPTSGESLGTGIYNKKDD